MPPPSKKAAKTTSAGAKSAPAPSAGALSKGAAPPPPKGPAPKLDAKTLGLRIGLPLVVVWVIALIVGHWIAFTVAGVLTAAAIGVVVFALTFTRKGRRVREIVGAAQTAEGRKEALETIEKEFKKGDSAAIFAKAQLKMHEDPQGALDELETIDLGKVMPNVADEARAQRAMIHLMLGQTQPARRLVDAIDLGRHQDPKAKATVAAVVCEAWARTGQAKRAVEILQLFDANDPPLADARPGLLRAQVFAYGAVDDLKKATAAMYQLSKIDPRIVGGFAQKGVHPLLVKEARRILERAGLMQRQMVRGPMR